MREGNQAAALEYLAQNDAEYDFVGSPVDEADLIRTLEIQAGENPQELFDESGLQDKSKKQDYEIKREKANRVSKNENSRRADRFQAKAEEAAERQKTFDFGLVPLGDAAVSDSEGQAVMAGRSGGPVDAYNAIQAKVQSGEIDIDAPVPGGNGNTVRDVLRRIEETEFPGIRRDRDIEQGRNAVADSRRRREARFLDSEIADIASTRARRMGDNKVNEVAAFDPSDKDYKNTVSAIEDELIARRDFAEEGGFDSNRAETIRNLQDEAFDLSRSDERQKFNQGRRNLDRIEQIKAIGAVKDKNPANMTREAMFDDSASYETAARMVGPDGTTVGYADPRGEAFLGDINSSNTANMQNAPQLPRGYDWVAQNVGGSGGRPGATSFGEPSDVDITGTLRDFVRRVNTGEDDGIISDIRSMGEFEGAVDRVIQKAEQKGDSLFSFSTEAGKNTAATAPGVDEVLNKLHYSSPDKARLAQALYQLSAAQESGVNQDYKDSYASRTAGPTKDVNFGSIGDNLGLAKVRNEKVGKGKNRKEVRAALSNLSDPDAAKPFIGAVEGEGAPRAQFLSAGAAKMTPEQRIAKYGAANGGIANAVEARAEEGRLAREERMKPKSDPLATQQRALDSEFAEKGRQIELDKNAREIGELRRLQAAGKLNVPSNSSFNTDARFQSITEAPVPESIAPQPGASTGNQAAPGADAGRSYMSSPDMQDRGSSRRQIIDKLSTPRNRRIGYGAAAAGGIAGLASLISGEREEREEEAMYR